MIFSMMVDAATYILEYFCVMNGYYTAAGSLYALNVAFENFVHWMFCYIYLKLQTEENTCLTVVSTREIKTL